MLLFKIMSVLIRYRWPSKKSKSAPRSATPNLSAYPGLWCFSYVQASHPQIYPGFLFPYISRLLTFQYIQAFYSPIDQRVHAHNLFCILYLSPYIYIYVYIYIYIYICSPSLLSRLLRVVHTLLCDQIQLVKSMQPRSCQALYNEHERSARS